MPTDDERRAVARRLRRSRSEWSGMGWRLWLGPKFCAVVLSDGNKDELEDAAHLLADLIEPSEPEVRCVAEVKVDGERLEQLAHDAAVKLTGIDRDALLVEAKELEKCAWYFGLDFDEDEPLRDRLKEASEAFAESARCIREALGVDDG